MKREFSIDDLFGRTNLASAIDEIKTSPNQQFYLQYPSSLQGYLPYDELHAKYDNNTFSKSNAISVFQKLNMSRDEAEDFFDCIEV